MRVVYVLGSLLALAVCLAPNTEAQFFRGFRHGFLCKRFITALLPSFEIFHSLAITLKRN